MCLWMERDAGCSRCIVCCKREAPTRLWLSTHRTVNLGSQAQVSVEDKDWQIRDRAGALCELPPPPAVCSAAHQKAPRWPCAGVSWFQTFPWGSRCTRCSLAHRTGERVLCCRSRPRGAATRPRSPRTPACAERTAARGAEGRESCSGARRQKGHGKFLAKFWTFSGACMDSRMATCGAQSCKFATAQCAHSKTHLPGET